MINAVVVEGMSCRAAAARFGVSWSLAIKWVERVERSGSRTAAKMGGYKRVRLEPHRAFLEGLWAEKSDITLQALCDRLLSERGVKADTSLMSPLLAPSRRHALKKTLVAREQDHPDVKRHRLRWRSHQRRVDPSRLVFIDETVTKTNMTRLYGWAQTRLMARRQGPAWPRSGRRRRSSPLCATTASRSILAQWQGDIDEGEQLASRILEISKTAVDQEHVYEVAIHLLAIAASKRGDHDRAHALLEESIAIGRRGGDPWLFAIALNNLGNQLMSEGEYERSVELFEESLAMGEARGDLDRRARAYNNLGWAMHCLGDFDRMRDFYERALEAATEIGLVESQLWALFGLAVVETEVGQARVGARLFGRMTELKSQLGAANIEQDDLERQTLLRLEARLGPELLASELAAGAALALEDAIDLALGRGSVPAG